jgi:Protein of unknown function (DUF3892)
MAEYIVTKVHKQSSVDGSHSHIQGVCTEDGTYYSREEVVDSINDGNVWRTRAGGSEETIKVLEYCPRPRCFATPYIKTNPDSTKKDNLENLDPC